MPLSWRNVLLFVRCHVKVILLKAILRQYVLQAMRKLVCSMCKMNGYAILLVLVVVLLTQAPGRQCRPMILRHSRNIGMITKTIVVLLIYTGMATGLVGHILWGRQFNMIYITYVVLVVS